MTAAQASDAVPQSHLPQEGSNYQADHQAFHVALLALHVPQSPLLQNHLQHCLHLNFHHHLYNSDKTS